MKTSREKSRKAIRAIRELIAKASKEDYAVEVWALLTALRGPDYVGSDAKNNTTAHIRSFVMPNNCDNMDPNMRGIYYPNVYRPSDDSWLTNNNLVNDAGEHFAEHFEQAVEVIRASRMKPLKG